MVVLPNFIAYRIALAGAESAEERAGIKSLFGKVGAITLVLFIPFALVVLWLSRNLANHSFLSGLLATGLVLIFLPTTIILSIASQRKAAAICYGRWPKNTGAFIPACLGVSQPAPIVRLAPDSYPDRRSVRPLEKSSEGLDSRGSCGLWRIVCVRRPGGGAG